MTTPAVSPLPALLADRAAYQQRLGQIVPREVTGVSDTDNAVAAAVVFVMMYVGVIGVDCPVRPSTITWMSNPISVARTNQQRTGYYAAAVKSERALTQHCAAQGIQRGEPWYAANSREPVRASMYALRDNGALRMLPGVDTTASRPRYVLAPEFAALLDPALIDAPLEQAIATWRALNLTGPGRARAQRLHQQAKAEGQILVALPGGGTRALHSGGSSAILKGVIEEFAPARLLDPVVIFISQSGEPVNVVDNVLLNQLGLPIDGQWILPDCLLFDLDPSRDELWLVEVVHTDGPVTEERRALFINWATQYGISADKCRFLTAFESRTNDRVRRALPVLARNSHAWFADEPDGLLTWGDLVPAEGA